MPKVTQRKGGLSEEGGTALFALCCYWAQHTSGTTAPVLTHNAFVLVHCFILVSVEFPSLLFPTISGDTVLVVRASKEPPKKSLDLHSLYFPDSKTLAEGYFLLGKSDSPEKS